MASKTESQLTPANRIFLSNSYAIQSALTDTLKDVLGLCIATENFGR